MKVIGVGDNVVDKYLHLNKMYPGGNALNFSVYAKKLGFNSAYMGIFGDDEVGQHIMMTLNKFEIDISHCRVYHGENGYAEVNLLDGERVFVGGNKGGVSTEQALDFSQNDLDYFNEFELIHTSCYSNIENNLNKLKKLDVLISYDFSNRIEDEYLKEICPNVNYAILSCGHLSVEETKSKLRNTINYGCDLALATRGDKGAFLYYQDNFYYQEAHIVEPVDTLGAGDSFLTSFLLGFIFISKDSREVIKSLLNNAAEFAAKTCLVEGAFEESKKII